MTLYTRRMRRLLFCLPVAGLLLVFCGACGPSVDVKQTVRVADISGGFHDAGVDDAGRNKIVPSITFRLTKSTDAPIHPLSVNLLFKKVPLPGTPPEAGAPSGALEDWDEFYIQNVDFNGNSTAPLTVRSKAGYTGDPPMSRADILTNHLFQDVVVIIFAKHSSGQWVQIAQYQLPRKLLTD